MHLPLLLLLWLTPLALFAEFKVGLYGFIKAEAEYNSKDTGSACSPQAFNVPLNTDKAAQHGEFLMDARHSRVGVRASDEWGAIRMWGQLEGDFYTRGGDALTSNGRFMRVRLAYAKAEMPCGMFFLAGQFRSLMWNDEIADPDLVDYSGPVGSMNPRQPQLRFGYSQECTHLKWEADVEKQSLNTLGVVNIANETNTEQGSGQKLPLFVAKVSWIPNPFQWELATCMSKCYVTPTSSSSQESTPVWGVQTSAQYTIGPLTPYLSTHYFHGVNRLARRHYHDCVLTNSLSLKAITSYAFYVGGHYEMTEKTAFNAVYGWERANRVANSSFSGDVIQHYHSFHANGMHSFRPQWKLGVEYERMWIRAFNGTPGDVNIYHAAIWYYF